MLCRILVEETLTETAAGVGHQKIDGAAAGGDALDEPIGFDRIHCRTELLEICGCQVDALLIGGNDQIIAVLRCAFRQFVADAGEAPVTTARPLPE